LETSQRSQADGADFGTSVITGQPVLDDVLSVFPAMIELSTLALLIGVGVGVPIGVVAAVRRGRWSDHLIRLVAFRLFRADLLARTRCGDPADGRIPHAALGDELQTGRLIAERATNRAGAGQPAEFRMKDQKARSERAGWGDPKRS
jgi:hypothetical protein